MNTQKKRIVVYFLIIFCGFLGAYFFLRKKNAAEENTTKNNVTKKDSLVSASLLSESFDLENNGEAFISTENFTSGKKSCKLSPTIEYGVSISKNIGDIPSYNNLKSISVAFNCLQGAINPDALYVLSINDDKGKSVFWAGEPILCPDNKGWKEAGVNFIIAPEFLNPAYTLAVYPWNRNKKEFYIDDIRIDYIGTVVHKNEPLAQSEKTNLFFDFETDSGLTGTENIKETTAHSGKKAFDFSGGIEYGPTVNKKMSEIGPVLIKKISLSVWVYPLTDNPNTVLTASIVNSKNETVFWEGKSTENVSFKKNKWTKINTICSLPIEKLSPDDVLGLSVWNKGKTDVIVDDLEIVYGDAPERRGNASTVDATAIYEKRFVGEKNKPPYKIIYFEKQEIKNKNGTSITPPDPKISTCGFSPNDEFFVGDFFPDKYNLDEILCVSADGCKGLYSYSTEEKHFNNLWQKARLDDSIWFVWDKCSVYSGDFNSDNKQDVLLVNKQNNNWELMDFNGKEWATVSKGKNPKKEWLAKNKNETVFPGNYLGNKQTVLKLNNDWRFDLKLMENDLILGNVDFKGYPNDYNPKYYEFVKIVPGNFLSKNQTSLLVLMCNCADADFKGIHCQSIENLPYLPNSVQLYNISPQISQIITDKK